MSQNSAPEYDAVVCGAGPAGLKAAIILASRSEGRCRVALFDRKEPWKEPVFCAEAVSRHALEQYWPVQESWIREHLDGVFFTSPDGTKVNFHEENCGFILNRAAFHREMADVAREKGVVCGFSVECRRIFREGDFWNVETVSGGEVSVVRTRVVVDATGPGAKLTRDVPGLSSLETGDVDLEPAIFAIVENVEHDPHHIELLFGSRYFPGGYGWVFPRDGKTVNVGLVNGRRFLRTHPPRKILSAFLAECYPKARILSIQGGAIACGQSSRPLAVAGVFKAGDAASAVNPISRSGIVEALKSGGIAGDAASEWLSATSEKDRRSIEESVLPRWMNIQGKSHARLAKAKVGFSEISDAQFNKAAHRLAAIPQEKRTLFRIFFTVLFSSPALLWKMRSFII